MRKWFECMWTKYFDIGSSIKDITDKLHNVNIHLQDLKQSINTDIALLENQLALKELVLQQISDCLPDMLWMKDLDGKYVIANKSIRDNLLVCANPIGMDDIELATTEFVTTADALKANIASPTFTGTPSAPTATSGTNTTQIATTEFVQSETSGFPSFSAYRSGTNQSGISTGVFTKLQYQTEVYDTTNAYDNATNYRYTPQKAGKYLVVGAAQVTTSGLTNGVVSIYKNGTVYKYGVQPVMQSTGGTLHVAAIVDMNGTTDYIELYVFMQGTTLAVSFTQSGSYFQASYLKGV